MYRLEKQYAEKRIVKSVLFMLEKTVVDMGRTQRG